MNHFTPASALAGGLMIGLASVVLLWFNGRIAGVSGIASGLFFGAASDRPWHLAFLVGLVAGTAAWAASTGTVPVVRPGFGPGLLVGAGLLVGFGTSMAKGCTSGHGVCGLARFSRRSLVATAVFLVVAVLATAIVRHVLHVS